jgi:hypothetical protein
MTAQEQRKELELNIFARFFGNMLVDLKSHDLRLKRQSADYRPYARTGNSTIDFVSYSR